MTIEIQSFIPASGGDIDFDALESIGEVTLRRQDMPAQRDAQVGDYLTLRFNGSSVSHKCKIFRADDNTVTVLIPVSATYGRVLESD